MRKYRIHIGIFVVALTVLVFYFFCIHREWSAKESLSRAQVAKMLAFLKYDQTGCEEILEDTKAFLPTDVEQRMIKGFILLINFAMKIWFASWKNFICLKNPCPFL